MRFSLICGTAGRVVELERMLSSVATQTFGDYELLVIDQNKDDRAARAIEALPAGRPVRRLTADPGLIPALNLGLGAATGDILGFPDDDCWYPRDLLRTLNRLLKENPQWDGITMPTADDEGRPSIARWHAQAGRLTKATVGLRGCSTSMFFRRRVYETIGGFDESIGGGLLSPSADMDYLHRAVRAGFHIEYRPELTIGHPQTFTMQGSDAKSLQKRYSYGFGEGSIARKFSLPLWYVAGITALPLLRCIAKSIAGKRDQACMEWTTFRGRTDGFRRQRALSSSSGSSRL